MEHVKLFENFDSSESSAIIGKKGDSVWRLMTRDNPQLGTYYVFSKVNITRVSPKSISCDDNAVYNKETGQRTSKQQAAYGSADYQIMNNEEADEMNNKLNDQNKRVKGFTIE
jgi:hypothetical protein